MGCRLKAWVPFEVGLQDYGFEVLWCRVYIGF